MNLGSLLKQAGMSFSEAKEKATKLLNGEETIDYDGLERGLNKKMRTLKEELLSFDEVKGIETSLALKGVESINKIENEKQARQLIEVIVNLSRKDKSFKKLKPVAVELKKAYVNKKRLDTARELFESIHEK